MFIITCSTSFFNTRKNLTSAAVERSFSAAGLAITERRSAFDPDTVNDILFVRSIQNILEKQPDFFS